MHWTAFTVELVKALAWPLAILVTVLLLRKPLVRLLPHLLRLRYKDFELEFGEKLEKLGARVGELSGDVRPAVTEVEVSAWTTAPGKEAVAPKDWLSGLREGKLTDQVQALAYLSPRAAITEAWRHLEQAIDAAAVESGRAQPRSFQERLDLLQAARLFGHVELSIARDLRALRNQAVHKRDFPLAPDQAIEFARVVEILIGRLGMGKQPAAILGSDRSGPRSPK